jgi:hypothetical protein
MILAPSPDARFVRLPIDIRHWAVRTTTPAFKNLGRGVF